MLLATIKEAQVAARKARDSARATLLTTLIGEAEMVGKSSGNRASTDAEVLDVLRKFEKNAVSNQKIYGERHMMKALEVVDFELGVLRTFLPQALSNGQVTQDILKAFESLALPMEQKSMGPIVATLKKKYGSQFNGQQVSTLCKEIMKQV